MLARVFLQAGLAFVSLSSVLGAAIPNYDWMEDDAQMTLDPADAAAAQPSNQEILKALQLAPTEIAKLNVLLPNPKDPKNFTYTFINNTVEAPTGGTIALATVANFPALALTNVALGIGFVNPCGLNVPHTHPRANEFLTVVEGSLIAGLVLETGEGGAGNVVGAKPSAPLRGPQIQFNTTLTNYTGTVFPQGSTHFQFNPHCAPAVFAAAFDSRDPGRTQTASEFLSVLPDKITQSGLGDPRPAVIKAEQLDALRGKVPRAFATLIESCAKKCGIDTKSMEL